MKPIGAHLAHSAATDTESRRAWWLSVGMVAAFSFLVIGSYIPNQEPLSPFDEWVYLDYVDKMARFDLPQRGEQIDREALEVSSCRGVFVWGSVGSRCGGPYVSTEYPLTGITSADIHPPTYFGANATIASIIRTLGLSDDVLTSNRFVGAIWLALGLVLVLVLSKELGAPLAAGVGVAGVLATLPLTRYTNSYITPDALNITIGAAVLIASIRVARNRWPWWSMLVAGALAGSIKTQNALVIAAAALFLAWRFALDWSNRSDRRVSDHLRAAVGVVLAFLAAQLLYLAARQQLSLGAVPSHGGGSTMSLNLLVRETTSFVLRLGLGATEDGQPIPAYAYLSTALLLAGCCGAVLYRSAVDDRWRLSICLVLLVFLGSPLLLSAQMIVLSEVVPSPTRYGGSLLAGIAAMTAAAFPSRNRSLALGVFGTVLVLVVTGQNLAA